MKNLISINVRSSSTHRKAALFSIFFASGLVFTTAQALEYIPAEVDFSVRLQAWDGFGFNYVEMAQSLDYDVFPQDYGGFSKLSESAKDEISELVFGEAGLQVQIVKLFLDPNHARLPGGGFDHERTTAQMMDFVRRGIQKTRRRGDYLDTITTLYGPPAWAKLQKQLEGRDLDPAQVDALCAYMVDWVEYLSQKDVSVKYLSLHNEGEDFYRWDYENALQRLDGFDYNMYWPPSQVNLFLKALPQVLAKRGLSHIAVTNGEPSNWTRFYNWGYADALYEDEVALDQLGLLTSHGFIDGGFDRLSYGLADGRTVSLLRQKKPDLKAWVTSISWGRSGTHFLHMVHQHIYSAGINALIPWAGLQNPREWIDGDPNPSTAITVGSDGRYSVSELYYFYKQITSAGHRGMSVVKTRISNPVSFITAFSGNDTGHPDAFTLTSNIVIWSRPIRINIKGTASKRFKAYRSVEGGSELFKEVGIFEVQDGAILYDPPPHSTTTFIALEDYSDTSMD